MRRQEFVVGGFTDPEGSREEVGSLLLGYYAGSSLRYAGVVGTGGGWNDAFGRKLRELLEPIEVDATPFEPAPPGALRKLAHGVEPRLVAEVQFAEWTDDGKIRHPSLGDLPRLREYEHRVWGQRPESAPAVPMRQSTTLPTSLYGVSRVTGTSCA